MVKAVDMKFPLLDRVKQFLFGSNRPVVLRFSLFFAAFFVPTVILYVWDTGSFEFLWKGRAPYLLFFWLFFLDAVLGWKKLKEIPVIVWNRKTVLTALFLVLPTVYAVGLKFGFYDAVVEFGRVVGVPFEQFGEWYLTHSWPFSFEFVLFGVLFVVGVWLVYGFEGWKVFSVSGFFLCGVGIFYMIDTFYPYGTFTVLQSFVPVTVSAASFVLNLLGYGTQTFPGGEEGLRLTVTSTTRSYSAFVSWSCAGIYSLFIYSFMIMLFLRGSNISRGRKIGYVVVGAVGTFFVNVLRIAVILLAGVTSGSSLAEAFHEFYGEFFFIAWMFIYLTVIYVFETRLTRRGVVGQGNG